MSNPADLRLRRFWPLVIGLLELVVMVMVARQIGLGWTILLLLLPSVAGLALLRIEGFRAWASIRQAAAVGQLDRDSGKVADTAVRILAGILLTVPGFLTDLAALVLLIPAVRRIIGQRLSAAAIRTFPGSGSTRPSSSTGAQHRPVVIEGEIVDHGPASDRPDRHG